MDCVYLWCAGAEHFHAWLGVNRAIKRCNFSLELHSNINTRFNKETRYHRRPHSLGCPSIAPNERYVPEAHAYQRECVHSRTNTDGTALSLKHAQTQRDRNGTGDREQCRSTDQTKLITAAMLSECKQAPHVAKTERKLNEVAPAIACACVCVCDRRIIWYCHWLMIV